MKKWTVLALLVVASNALTFAQTELDNINAAIMDYIEGTANGEPDRLKKTFHPDLNLYFVKDDKITAWSGQGYVGNVKKGVKSNRIGKIISVDYVNDAAMAKVEVDMPARKRLYTDYLLLLKEGGQWKIIHKSFTYEKY
ncbi:MAG: nuclear transport factor 2 family protein [Bacteroidota bacterium]